MSNTFYGGYIRDRFPIKSKVRMEEDSNGAKFFNAIGTHIEKRYRSKVKSEFCQTYLSSDINLNTLSNLHVYELDTQQVYRSSALQETVDEIKIDGFVYCKSLEELYNTDAESYSFEDTTTNVNPLIVSVNKKNDFTTYTLNEEDFVYVNVKEITSTNSKSIEDLVGVTLRGKKRNGDLVEEFIKINSCKMYRSKNTFKTLERLEPSLKHGLSGGASISTSGLKEFNIEVLQKPYKTWLEGIEDSRTLDSNGDPFITKVKRIEIENLISKPKTISFVFENVLSDNVLTLELVAFDNPARSKLRLIHRYFESVDNYKNENNFSSLEDSIFEEILSEVELVDNSNTPIDAIDFEYNPVDCSVYVLDSNNNLHIYTLGRTEYGSFDVERTFNPGVRIDVIDTEYLSGDSFNVRVINGSLDAPLSLFAIGKIEDDTVRFLNVEKTDWSKEISLFSAEQSPEDLQDSLDLITFSLDMTDNNIEVFVMSLDGSSSNEQAIFEINNNDEELNVKQIQSKLDLNTIVSRKIIRSFLTPRITYETIVGQEFTLTGLYYKGNDSSLWFVTNTNNHYRYVPIRNTFIFNEHCLYFGKPIVNDLTAVITLTNQDTVEVLVNA